MGLHRFNFSGRTGVASSQYLPGFAGHPARLPKAGFVFFKSGKFLPSWADHIGPRQDKSDSLAPANGIFAVSANGLGGA